MLIFDHAKKKEDINAHDTSDLEAYYDRKMSDLCGSVEETIGVNKKSIKLITNVFARLEYHT